MSIEAVAAAMPAAEPQFLRAGYGASLTDIGSFQGAMSSAAAPSSVGAADVADSVSPAIKGMFTSLEKVDGEAKSVSEYARAAQASGAEMTPGEVIQLTMRCHEFMFHCQLSSSIANRTSDGLQQLFRQQS